MYCDCIQNHNTYSESMKMYIKKYKLILANKILLLPNVNKNT